MKKLALVLFGLFMTLLSLVAQTTKMNVQVLVVGGTTGGTAAGIQSARSGAKTLIVEQTHWLGGMLTAAGVSCTDGNHELRSGIWEEFRQALYQHYQTNNLFAGWVSETCFEPHVGDSIFKSMAGHEPNLQVVYGWYFDKVLKRGNKVTGAVFINSKGEKLEVNASVTVDATDLGDVFADAGVAYDLGTEDSTQSGESIAPGKSNVIQDLTWAATLTNFGKGADKTIPVPPGYHAARYYCSTSEAPCNGQPYALNTQKVLDYGKLRVSKGAADKYMLNWPAHGNDAYLDVVEMKPIEREKEYVKAKNITLGFLYFLQTELKQPHIGLAEDEMDKGLAWVPYNREGRRVRGEVRLNIDHIRSPYAYTLYRTGIAVGDYPVDHHHAQYPGKVPPIPFPKVPSFNIPLGALLPKGVEGLVVCEKGISVSNIANGTTRLQPVVLLTGQAAGVIAAKKASGKEKQFASGIRIREIQQELLQNKCYLMPFVDVRVDDPAWSIIQWVGLKGLIKGVGKSIGWANKTYFYPDSLMLNSELMEGFTSIYELDAYKETNKTPYVNLAQLLKLHQHLKQANTVITDAEDAKLRDMNTNLKPFQLVKKNNQAPLTRKEAAVYLDYLFGSFDKDVCLDGTFCTALK
ncbi:MAG: FAD-dependent oxidoreductase [Chitinophagaceae bacterium]|nr:FAD-dependent oxidoreductase [Chitinophagaceae bacterium]MCA6453141.1 FAD-dependent oxidoreductase [Chitinophagaceae bacterium]MCA6457837.1 FAD-dependent oxidoreductase [Chitinophagaceae bacterium]MCA6463550.1 FAD-dependent oxidoreductase [Chitinophagaceae bacterium]